MPARPLATPDPTQLPYESLSEMAASLTKERSLKVVAFLVIFIVTAVLGDRAHRFLPIVLFVLFADVVAINRERRLLASISATLAERFGETPPAYDASEADDED